MKHYLAIFLMFGLILTCGVAIAGDKAPDITGTWQGTATGHHNQHGFIKSHPDRPNRMKITGQQDRVFKGKSSWSSNDGRSGAYELSGYIHPDNKTLHMATSDGATITGTMKSPTSMHLIKKKPGGKDTRIIIKNMKKVK
jgi:hypothetical protein